MNVSEDILFTILANLSFDELLEKRQDPQFKAMTESPILLHLLANIHRLPPRDSFDRLLEEYDRRNLTRRCRKYHNPWQCGPYFALIDDIEGVKRAEALGWSNWNWGMAAAAEGGHREGLDLVKYFIGKGTGNLNWAMTEAAKSGYRHIVEFLVGKGARDSNWGVRAAAEGGHLDLVEYFIAKGADDWDGGMESAAENGHLDLVKYFAEKGASESARGESLYFARKNEHKDVVQWLEENML